MNKPAVSQQCHIPCPVGCELSAYGEWNACPETCPQGRDTCVSHGCPMVLDNCHMGVQRVSFGFIGIKLMSHGC